MPPSPPIRHVAIWGLGAIGTLLAARILPRLRPGETLRVIADAPRIARYRVAPPTFNGTPLLLDYADPAALPPPLSADLILVTVKTPDLPAAPANLTPFIAPHTLVLPLLNGLSATDRLSALIPSARVLHGLVLCNSAARTGHDVTQSGTLDIRLDDPAAAAWLAAHDLPATVPDDMQTALWRKFILNVGLNQAEAATGLAHGPLQASPEAMALLRALVDEAIAVAAAEGIPRPEQLAREAFDALAHFSPEGKTSMLQDVEAGRPPEIDAFAGEIVRRAAPHRIPVPANLSLIRRFSP